MTAGSDSFGDGVAVQGLPPGVTATPDMLDLGSNPINTTTIRRRRSRQLRRLLDRLAGRPGPARLRAGTAT
ncbi:MAG TPA: hypothetical protein VIX73_34665 [Kofleriaceae bacterium]